VMCTRGKYDTLFLCICLVVYVVTCPSLTDLNNGAITCSLGDDGIPSYEDICSFACDIGYELTGSGDTRTCQNDGNWSGSEILCRKGIHIIMWIVLYSD